MLIGHVLCFHKEIQGYLSNRGPWWLHSYKSPCPLFDGPGPLAEQTVTVHSFYWIIQIEKSNLNYICF